MLEQLGETPLRPMGDAQLMTDLQSMNGLIQQTTDDAMKNIAQTNEKKVLSHYCTAGKFVSPFTHV